MSPSIRATHLRQYLTWKIKKDKKNRYYVLYYKTSLRNMSHSTLSYCLTKPTSHVASTPLQVALKKPLKQTQIMNSSSLKISYETSWSLSSTGTWGPVTTTIPVDSVSVCWKLTDHEFPRRCAHRGRVGTGRVRTCERWGRSHGKGYITSLCLTSQNSETSTGLVARNNRHCHL